MQTLNKKLYMSNILYKKDKIIDEFSFELVKSNENYVVSFGFTRLL